MDTAQGCDGRRPALHEVQKAAHVVLDRLWRDARCPAFARSVAYQWLAEQMGLSRERCHFSLFDEAECVRALRLARGASLKRILGWWKDRALRERQEAARAAAAAAQGSGAWTPTSSGIDGAIRVQAGRRPPRAGGRASPT